MRPLCSSWFLKTYRNDVSIKKYFFLYVRIYICWDLLSITQIFLVHHLQTKHIIFKKQFSRLLALDLCLAVTETLWWLLEPGLLSDSLAVEYCCYLMPHSPTCFSSIAQSLALVGLLSCCYPATDSSLWMAQWKKKQFTVYSPPSSPWRILLLMAGAHSFYFISQSSQGSLLT